MWSLRLAKRASIAAPPSTSVLLAQHRRLTMRTTSQETLAALKEVLGDRLATSAAIREQHGRDESYHAVAPPDAVAFVQTTEEVSKVIKICAAARTPVIAFGAGSSLEGHISATYGGVSIDLTGMNNIMTVSFGTWEIDLRMLLANVFVDIVIAQVEPENMSCRVEAGVTREQLNVELRATGLFFPVDPGANATLGGMISTNASGTTTVRYGNMKNNVMALTAVMPDGRIIKTGSKTRKSSAGYDLTRLLIGSEGTLGIITEAELRLYGIPEAEKTMICSFPTIKNAVDTCATVMQMGVQVARMELMDENAVQAINKYSKLNNPVRPSLIIEHHGSPSEIEEQSAVVQEIATEFEAQDIQLASTVDERKKLWSGRHAAWYATMAEMPGSRALSTDVCVPMSRLADIIVETQEDLKKSQIFGTIVGHVGDGNFHVMIPFFSNNDALMTQVKQFSDRLVMRALRAEGTCTGEHGVGNGKMDYLQIEHGDSVSVMLAIKNAIDPLNIMNPGKIFFGNAYDAKNTYEAAAGGNEMEEAARTHAVTAASAGKTSLEISGDVKLFINRFGSGGDLPALAIPLELKILGALVMLFLFLLFLIAVLWDCYGKEIGELYTPGGAASRGDVNTDVNVNDVADEYTVYQKLPTFFYEYTRKKKN